MKYISRFAIPHDRIAPNVLRDCMAGTRAWRILLKFDDDGRIQNSILLFVRASRSIFALDIEALPALADSTDDRAAAEKLRGLFALYQSEQRGDTSDRPTRAAH